MMSRNNGRPIIVFGHSPLVSSRYVLRETQRQCECKPEVSSNLELGEKENTFIGVSTAGKRLSFDS